jgi:hypothetical protein
MGVAAGLEILRASPEVHRGSVATGAGEPELRRTTTPADIGEPELRRTTTPADGAVPVPTDQLELLKACWPPDVDPVEADAVLRVVASGIARLARWREVGFENLDL